MVVIHFLSLQCFKAHLHIQQNSQIFQSQKIQISILAGNSVW
jgi:hypothetical protein